MVERPPRLPPPPFWRTRYFAESVVVRPDRQKHRADVSLFVPHYNLCRIHKALGITPAMALGVTDHIWTIGELVQAALSPEPVEPEGKRVGCFLLIEGSLP